MPAPLVKNRFFIWRNAMLDIISLLSTDGYIVCNKTIIRLFGGDCAILLGELCAEYNYFKNRDELVDNMFYSTQDNIENMTGLNPYSQRKALNILKENNIIEVVRKGVPSKNYYKINEEQLFNIFTSSPLNFKQLEVQNLNLNNNKNNNNNTNTKVLVETPTKQKKLSLYDKCLNMIEEYTDDTKLRNLLVDFLTFRLSVKDKPIYANQFKALLNKLRKLNGDDKDIVSQSLENGWLSFYEFKNNTNNFRKSNQDKLGEFGKVKANKISNEVNDSGTEF